MSKVALVTDSTAYIPDDLLKKYEITVAPQVLIWGQETFRDGVDIQPDAFYQRLSTAKVMPSTSQVSIVDMKTIFQGLVEQGCDVLGIFLSEKLSGTMDSARQAIKMLPEMADKIAIVDSATTAMAMGFHVLAAARAAQGGESLQSCRQLAEEATQQTFVQAWRAASGFDGERPLEPWLATIARRVAIDIHRREARRVATALDDLPADDHAYALLPERRRARVQVVTRGNMYLEAALLLDEYLDGSDLLLHLIRYCEVFDPPFPTERGQIVIEVLAERPIREAKEFEMERFQAFGKGLKLTQKTQLLQLHIGQQAIGF